jgi:hypothetical protein
MSEIQALSRIEFNKSFLLSPGNCVAICINAPDVQQFSVVLPPTTTRHRANRHAIKSGAVIAARAAHGGHVGGGRHGIEPCCLVQPSTLAVNG